MLSICRTFKGGSVPGREMLKFGSTGVEIVVRVAGMVAAEEAWGKQAKATKRVSRVRKSWCMVFG